MGKEQANQENLQGAAKATIKGLAFSLSSLQDELKKQGVTSFEKEYLESSIEETKRYLIDLKNQFFPYKTWQEILSPKGKDKDQSTRT